MYLVCSVWASIRGAGGQLKTRSLGPTSLTAVHNTLQEFDLNQKKFFFFYLSPLCNGWTALRMATTIYKSV